MILIKNKQKKIKINENKITKNIEKILRHLKYEDFDIGIWFTTNQTIKKYNKKFRKKDKPTDILSFQYHEDLKPNQRIKIKEVEDKSLGDIIISAEYSYKDAIKLHIPFMQYLNILIVHGITHLLGYKHDTQKEFEQMQKFEEKLLNIIN